MLIINLISLVGFLIVEIITIVKEYLYINEFTDKAKEALATSLNWLLDPDSARFCLLRRGLKTYINTAKLITAFLEFFKVFLRV